MALNTDHLEKVLNTLEHSLIALKESETTGGEYDYDIFRQAARHGLITVEETDRWFSYRDNRNNTAHDYGEHFAEDTLKILPQFVLDARQLAKVIKDE